MGVHQGGSGQLLPGVFMGGGLEEMAGTGHGTRAR